MMSMHDNSIHSAVFYCVLSMVSFRSEFICILQWGNFPMKLEVRDSKNDISAFRLQVIVVLLGVDKKNNFGVTLDGSF